MSAGRQEEVGFPRPDGSPIDHRLRRLTGEVRNHHGPRFFGAVVALINNDPRRSFVASFGNGRPRARSAPSRPFRALDFSRTSRLE